MRFQTTENQENMISVWFYLLTVFLKKKVPFGYSGPASSPVARDHRVIFEFKIIEESGDEGSDGKGRKSEGPFPPLSPLSHHSPLVLYARSHHPSLALLASSPIPT